MTTNDQQYNGWANRETWALNLYLTNDQGLYELTRERVGEAVAELQDDDSTAFPSWADDDESRADWRKVKAGEAVKTFWEELTDPDEQIMTAEAILEMVRDIGSDYRVDWDEIGAYWLSDLDES